MIKKILIFGDYSCRDWDDYWDSSRAYLKTSALLRLSYALHKEGFEVKQVHHCASFNKNELEHIIKNFSEGEKILICVSSSFLSNTMRLDYHFHADEKGKEPSVGSAWGPEPFEFLKNIAVLSKRFKFPVIMGGFDIKRYKFTKEDDIKAWGLEILNLFIEYYIIGENHNEIVKFCKGEKLKHIDVRLPNSVSKIVYADPVKDWDDFAFTPTPGTPVELGEALITQIAAGCIFSCSFCTYFGLGKKAHQYCRTYESLKNEIVYNWENSKTRTYMIVDNMINDYWEKLEYLVRIRDETGIDVRWTAYARLDTIRTKQQAKLFRDSGCAGVIFGIESMKKEVGPYIGKMTDGEKIKSLLYNFRDAVGETCITSGSFIAGAPTESKEDLHATFEWLNTDEGRNLLDHYIFTPLFVEPGINERTEINRGRSDPWKEYVFNENKTIRDRGTGWTSPWGTYDEFLELAIRYSAVNNETKTVEDAMSARRGPFALPLVNNVLDGGVDEFVRICRNREPIYPYRHMFKKNTSTLFQNYKMRVLGNSYNDEIFA